MKFHAYYNRKKISYLLGAMIGLDLFLASLWPRAQVGKTISHRIGVKRVRQALKRGFVTRDEVMDEAGNIRPATTYALRTIAVLKALPLPLHRHPLAAVIDAGLERIDPGHCIDAID